MVGMEFAIALTLYLSFGAFLFFGTMNAPPVFARLAIGALRSEFVAAAAGRSAARAADTSTAATRRRARERRRVGPRSPALTGATFLLAVGYGLHVARRW